MSAELSREIIITGKLFCTALPMRKRDEKPINSFLDWNFSAPKEYGNVLLVIQNGLQCFSNYVYKCRRLTAPCLGSETANYSLEPKFHLLNLGLIYFFRTFSCLVVNVFVTETLFEKKCKVYGGQSITDNV